MDACFGLYRKKSKGYAVMGADSRHKNRLFADQDDVDNFVNNYSGSLRLSDPDIFSVNKVNLLYYLLFNYNTLA